MNVAFCLLLTAAAAQPAEPAANDNLDFSAGTLAGWKGEGFYITTAIGNGPSRACGVCSSDRGRPGMTGQLQRTFVVPSTCGTLRVMAYVARPQGKAGEANLDVRVESSNKHVLPKRVLVDSGWQPTKFILPPDLGQPREYLWDLAGLSGKTLRIRLVDDDDKPNCHLFCSGFRIQSGGDLETQDFSQFMVNLTETHNLSPMSQFNTKHFTALSNSDDDFTRMQLRNCELLYDLFVEHFRTKGFHVYKPANKLMVAIFDNHEGFDAYMGRLMPSSIAGMYDRNTNRLVVYDYGQNRDFLNQKTKSQDAAKTISSDLERQRYKEALARRAKDFKNDANIGTLMHEAAHHLSFNTGLLSRDGDVPVWLAEGLACYCESTDNGAWQGIGESNPERLLGLVNGQKANLMIPLRALIASDDWLKSDQGLGSNALVGYAQSWALFRMLVEERPKAFAKYLQVIQSRRKLDHRVTDFVSAFGDLSKLESHYQDYINAQIKANYHPKK